MSDVDRPVALITGAGGGIGRATAIELASQGCRLVLVGRGRERLEAAAEALIVTEALVYPADVSDPSACEAAVEAAVAAFGRLDALVNAAGFAPVLSIGSTTPQQWRAILDTNLSAAFYLMRAAWPHFERQNGGVVVNLSSFAARDPFPQLAAYAAAKAGLNGLSLAAAREGAAANVRVHALGLGAVETDMLRSVVSAEQLPSERTLTPEAVARVIGQCVTGGLAGTSGEVIWLSRTTAG